MGDDKVQHPDLCGASANSFKLGECKIGWAYVVVVIGSTLGVIAVLISWTPVKWKRKDKDGDSYAL